MKRSVLPLVAIIGLTSAAPGADIVNQQAPDYARSSVGTRILKSANGLAIKVLLERSNLGGGEVEVAEITLPPNPNAASHRHGSSEILYILSGELDHVVNDTSYLLRAGMLGVVRPGDRVAHRVHSSEPVRALVIWTPGGEVERLARSPAFQVEPIRGDSKRPAARLRHAPY
jgi:quercetin dioxygenase-like cupin family protein